MKVEKKLQNPGHRTVWLHAIAVAVASLAILAAGHAFAQDPAALYQAKAVVTGQSEKNRIPGFADCLRQVVVKVSGDQRLLAKPAFQDLLPKAGEFVSSFSYRDRLEGIPIHDEQGTYDRPHDLTCIFDRAKIDAALQSLGSRPWLAERPKLAVFLGVWDSRRSFLLSSDGSESPYMADSLAAAAGPLAIAVILPDMKTLASLHNELKKSHRVENSTFEAVAQQAGGDLALLGNLRWSDAALGWIATWSLTYDGANHEWSVRGVSFDEAFRVAMRGAAQILSGNGAPH